MYFKMQKTAVELRESSPSETKDDAASDLLSSKLNKMSLEERSHGLHELHGVADLKEETPEMMNSKLKEVNDALANTASLRIEEDSSAYYKALGLSPQYVEKLKLQCLRADAYNGREAAIRLIRFFDHKRFI